MKKIILMLITFVLFTSSFVYMKELNPNLVGKSIVIDVGHGGKDSGTVYDDVKEKDINLSIALKLRDELVMNGVNVILTRDGDYDLSLPNANRRKKSDFDNRINIINNSGADMYLSIHINYLGDAKYYGAQVFYTKGNEAIADNLQRKFVDKLKSPMNSRKISDDIYMYKKLKIPGVLIECGFLSNSKERKLLIDEKYQYKIVKSIVDGLSPFFP